jgi:hypothetical protein
MTGRLIRSLMLIQSYHRVHTGAFLEKERESVSLLTLTLIARYKFTANANYLGVESNETTEIRKIEPTVECKRKKMLTATSAADLL